jgi:hypothetical protein
METSAKTIQIFLPDGNPRSLKIAEITSRTVQAVLFPRPKIEEASMRDELSNVGVYLLFGPDENKPSVYIGEAENVIQRLKQHNKAKDFWTHAIAFVSKTQYFTKTHIKFLEWFCCEKALSANRYTLENGNSPARPHVSESVEADLMDNFETMQILISTLGYPVFDQMKSVVKKSELIYCKGKLAMAEGEYTDDGIVILKGSTCNLEEARTTHPYLLSMRTELIEKNILKEKDGVLVFQTDHLFNSPSTAASVVLARNSNGWKEWKYSDGKTLDEVKRQS